MRITELDSKYHDLEKMTTREILVGINTEDKTVPYAIEKVIPAIERLVDGIVERMRRGGRVFYIGAGTSGRLGIIDAAEIPPTYGMKDTFIGIIAGGDGAIRTPVEGSEDIKENGWKDVSAFSPKPEDSIIGVAASGVTPYTIAALEESRAHGLLTACITCCENAPIAEVVEYPISVIAGPEFVTGSTRMKAGTVGKLVLNMISTAVVIKLGRVRGNKMIDMDITNQKLVDRGTRMIMEQAGIDDYEKAKALLQQYGHVREAVDAWKALSR